MALLHSAFGPDTDIDPYPVGVTVKSCGLCQMRMHSVTFLLMTQSLVFILVSVIYLLMFV